MSINDQKLFYKNNDKYEKFLMDVDHSLYGKYLDKVSSVLSKEGQRFLDVGCGVGTVVHKISIQKRNIKAYGIDVSNNFIKKAKESNGVFRKYDGNKIPFQSKTFDVVGCFTVLEHVRNPNQLLREIVRVTNKSGSIIIAGPSFLRVFGFSVEHPRNMGIINVIKNLFIALGKYFQTIFYPTSVRFRFMEPINVKPFKADYDAVCETNMIDVRHFLKKYGVKIVYQSGLVDYHKSKIINLISTIPVFRDLTGGYFIMGVKGR